MPGPTLMTERRRLGLVAAALASAAALISGLPAGSEAAFPGENGQIALRCPHVNGICVTDPQGKVVTELTDSDGFMTDPAFSADGERITFSRENGLHGYDIFTMRSEGARVRRLTRAGADTFNYSPGFSPNGRRIVFQRIRDGRSGVYVMRADGTGVNRLTSGAEPSFSPDGALVVFTREMGPNDYPKVYLMDPDGSDVTLVTSPNDAVASRSPSFSPDGQRIVFGRSELGDFDGDGIFAIDRDGSDLDQITSPPEGEDREPSFSPDGSRIAFVRQRCSEFCNPALYVMDANGSNVERVLEDTDFGSAPDWGPKGAGPTPGATCRDQRATLVGTANPDLITGTAARDVVAARGEDDVVNGLGGNDLICAGAGPDRARGGAGRDRLLGERGADTLVGGQGRDRCQGGRGRDKLRSCER